MIEIIENLSQAISYIITVLSRLQNFENIKMIHEQECKKKGVCPKKY